MSLCDKESSEEFKDDDAGVTTTAKKASKVPPRSGAGKKKKSRKNNKFVCTERLLDAIEKGKGSIPTPKLRECHAAAHRSGRGKAPPKGPSLPMTTIARIMRNAAMNYSDVMRMEKKALELAQDVIERNLVERFNEVREVAEHQKRITVKHEDFRFVNQKYKSHQQN